VRQSVGMLEPVVGSVGERGLAGELDEVISW